MAPAPLNPKGSLNKPCGATNRADRQWQAHWLLLNLKSESSAQAPLTSRPASRHAPHKSHGNDHLFVAEALYEKGVHDLAQNRHKTGLDTLLEAFATQKKYLVPAHPHRITTATHQASEFIRNKEMNNAARLSEGVLADLVASDRQRPVEMATALTNLGICRARLGHPAEARDLLQQALAIREKNQGSKHAKSQRLQKNIERLDATLAGQKLKTEDSEKRPNTMPEVIVFK